MFLREHCKGGLLKRYRVFIKIFLIIPFICGSLFADAGPDTFGITRLYPSKPGTREWNSAHWNNGKPRIIKYSSDPDDPTGWTEDHSSSTDGFKIDGAGIMEMSGGGPRFHVNSLLASKVPAQKFRDVECTAYYRRKGAQGENYAGMVIGVHSGPLGHGSSGGNNCDATTYYARFRNDGKWDVEKELKHPESSYWSGSGANTQDPLWKGAKLPLNRWIGMKYLCYNIQNNKKVKLELYIDSSSSGTLKNGGHWEKVGEVVDEGNWSAGDVSGCAYQNTAIILEGGGTMLMRTDKDTADYQRVSIREIAITADRTLHGQANNAPVSPLIITGKSSKNFSLGFKRPLKSVVRFNVFDFQGKRTCIGSLFSSHERIVLPRGNYAVELREAGETRIVKIAVP